MRIGRTILAVATAATFALAPAAIAQDEPPGHTCDQDSPNAEPTPGGPTDADRHGRHTAGSRMGSDAAATENPGKGGMSDAEAFCDQMMHM